MNCPKCRGKQHCPCDNCATKNKGKITWKWVTGNGPIECGHCGHTMGMGDWMDEDYKQWEAAKEE